MILKVKLHSLKDKLKFKRRAHSNVGALVLTQLQYPNKLADQQGFSRAHQNGGWHYFGSDSRLPDRHAHLLSATGTGQWGKKTKTNKKTSGSHSVSFLAEMLVACMEGLIMTSVPKRGRGHSKPQQLQTSNDPSGGHLRLPYTYVSDMDVDYRYFMFNR